MQASRGALRAYARIRGGEEHPRLRGMAWFYQLPRGVMVKIRVEGLPADSQTGFFALHIHSGMSCAGVGFSMTGGHYDPGAMPHPRHAGDLPPLLSCGGNALLCVLTDRFCLRDVIGRTLVIHSGADDFKTQPAGNPGTKIACGRILLSNCAVTDF